jgi:hypothetical protein
MSTVISFSGKIDISSSLGFLNSQAKDIGVD